MLSTELYITVLEHLDYVTLLKCMQVCSLFRELIENTASLQYTIELVVAGQINGPEASGISSASRLESLKKHQSNWGSLKWSRELRIPMEDGDSWELYGGVLGQSTADGRLIFTQLPSDLRSIEEKVWTLGPNLGLVVQDFGMDPAQDLLVLVGSPSWSAPAAARKHSIHLRSLSDGNPHPLACNAPVLSHAQGVRGHNDVSYKIQVSGTFIAILFCSDDSNELGIWNWMTGELQVNVYGRGIRSCFLLSDTHVVLATYDNFGPQLVVMDFQQESIEPHTLEHLQCAIKFYYPEFESAFFLDIDIRSDPSPLWRPDVKLHVPFSQDTNNVLLVVSLWILMGDRHTVKCLIQFLPSNGLASLVGNAVTTRYEWGGWGPHRSRFLISAGHSDTWVCYVHGCKYVVSEPNTSQHGFVAQLYDFNQVGINRNCRGSGGKGTVDQWLYKTVGTVFGPKTMFEDLVESTLPYRSQVLCLEDAHKHCHALCSEDHIIMVDPRCREYRVLIF